MGKLIKVTTTGTAANATGSGTGTGHGNLKTIGLKYHASAPATTDVTIKRTINGVDEVILAVANNATSGIYHPKSATHLPADGTVISGEKDDFFLEGELITVSVAGSDALTDCVAAFFQFKNED